MRTQKENSHPLREFLSDQHGKCATLKTTWHFEHCGGTIRALALCTWMESQLRLERALGYGGLQQPYFLHLRLTPIRRAWRLAASFCFPDAPLRVDDIDDDLSELVTSLGKVLMNQVTTRRQEERLLRQHLLQGNRVLELCPSWSASN